MRSTLPGEAKQQCRRCGHPLSAGATRCPACLGAVNRAMGKHEPSEDIYLMLVTANVLRLRRQFELAESQCSEVLRRDSENASAHSVMGDIARDRGNLRDAIEWYKMALDLNAGNMADRKKLEAVIDRVYAEDAQTVLGRLRADVTESLGSAAAEIRAARIPSPVSAMLAAMVAVIILVTVVVLVLGRGAVGVPQTAAAEPPSSGAFTPAATDPLEPKPMDRAAAAEAAATGPRFGAEVAAIEAALLEGLREQARIMDPNCEVREAEINPLDGTASVQISMPRFWSSENTRNTILRVAAPLAAAAAEWDSRIPRVRVRCSVRQQGQPDRLALVAEADALRLWGLLRDPGAYDPEEIFTIWWDPELYPELEFPPSPGVR